MSASNPYQKALEDMKAALVQLSGHSVLPTPTCLFVWYCYLTGVNADLVRELQALEKQGGITEAKLVELSHHVFGTPPDVLDRIGEKTARIMAETSQQISQAAERESEFGRDLEDFDRAIAANDQVEMAQVLIAQLAERTRAMQQQTAALESQLRESSSTIAGLQGQLERARQEASLDGLTGIANRRTFDTELFRLANEARTTRTPLSVAMIDIDHFKGFNDTYGHPLGDQLLRVVAKILTTCVKGGDLVARYGGEEFSVLLPKTKLEQAVHVAGQIRRAIAGNRVILRNNRRDLGSVTVSIGVAQFELGESAADMVARADRGLYQAKAAGRNRVIASAERAGPAPSVGVPAEPTEALSA